MNQKKQNRKHVKGIQHFLGMVLIAGMFTGCSFFGEQAPLTDGLYLNYDIAGSAIRVTFSEIDADKFYATLSFGPDIENSSDRSSMENREIVDKRLKTEKGAPYEAGSLGPLWIPPSSVKKGGNAHGDTISEVREWNGWEIGVLKASFGRGALRGEWYYEKNTGFLVGGMKATVMDDEGGGTEFVLDDSNLAGLF